MGRESKEKIDRCVERGGGERKNCSEIERERESENQDKDIGTNEGKGENISPPVIGASGGKDRKGWRVTVKAKGPRENSAS